MNKMYITASAILILAGLFLAFAPKKTDKPELKPEQLLLNSIDESRFFTTDEVAKMLMTKDPEIQLIDVRTADEFAKFSLPGAINIPLDSILNPSFEAYFNQTERKNIIYSTGTIYANQAWVLLSRLKYPNNYVLKGGLNEWFSTIINPVQPSADQPADIHNQYKFRVAARNFFTGNTGAVAPATTAPVNTEKSNNTAPVKKEKKQGGGC